MDTGTVVRYQGWRFPALKDREGVVVRHVGRAVVEVNWPPNETIRVFVRELEVKEVGHG